MRLWLMDKLLCSNCGNFPLRLHIGEVSQRSWLGGNVCPCESYCEYERKPLEQVSSPPCPICLTKGVIKGDLTCIVCGSHYPIEDGIPSFISEDTMSNWQKEEMNWWDRNYSKGKRPHLSVKKSGRAFAGNRLYERNVYLFAPIRERNLQNALVLDVGCGVSDTVASLLHPRDYSFFYLGTDISKEALKIAALLIPEGDFIHCPSERMPLRNATFDYVLLLGVLHHLENWKETLSAIASLLKPQGVVLFDEAIDKPRVLGKLRSHSLTASIDSPHEGEVSFNEFYNFMKSQGQLTVHLKYTPLRFLLVWTLGWPMERSVWLTRAVLLLDQLFLKSAGRISRSLSAGEVIGIWQKL